MSLEAFLNIFFFLLGSIVGSFLNVCIVRLPHEKSVVNPPSHCPKCQKSIQWYDNIPLLSYIVLGGKCRFCKERFSIRYFFVELLTGLTFVALYWYYGLDKILIPYLVMFAGFIVATFVDFEHRIIPDEVSVGGTVVGMIFSLIMPELQGLQASPDKYFLSHWLSLFWSFIGVLVGGGIVYAMGLLGDFMFKKESIGGGDVKLVAMIGAFMGWQAAILTFFIAPFFGAILGIYNKVRHKDSYLPYGPFLVLGAIISLFKGPEIIRWILSGYGVNL